MCAGHRIHHVINVEVEDDFSLLLLKWCGCHCSSECVGEASTIMSKVQMSINREEKRSKMKEGSGGTYTEKLNREKKE